MVHKNLRTLLYYVVGVTAVCLMIEVSKRNSGLDPALYLVETDASHNLASPPNAPPHSSSSVSREIDDEVIPRRNRGRPGSVEKAAIKEKEIDNLVDDKSDKEKFKLWKASMKISPEEVGLFKKWKQEQGRSKKQLRVKQEDYDDEDEEEDDRNEEDEDEDEDEEDEDEDEDEGEVDEGDVIENKSNKKIPSKKEENDDESDGYDDPEEEEEEDGEEDEYPEGVTEYDPPDSLHSCTDITMTDRLLDRANTASKACARLRDEIGEEKKLYNRLRWAVPERLLYCPVFKAASTSWLVNFLKLSNRTKNINPKVGNLHKKSINLFPAPATFKLRKKIFAESTKFIVVRHPFERIVSAYRDKLAGFTRNPSYLTMRKHVIDKYRKNKKSKSEIPTFRESFDFILSELDKREAGGEKILIDGHFMPYSSRCKPCSMNYDVIIKFETLEEDSQYLIEQCGLDDRIGVLHENQAPTGPETKQGFKNKSKKVKKGEEKAKKAITNTKTALDFFRDIPTSKIRRLYQHYRHDFEIFGYSAEEYLNIESS